MHVLFRYFCHKRWSAWWSSFYRPLHICTTTGFYTGISRLPIFSSATKVNILRFLRSSIVQGRFLWFELFWASKSKIIRIMKQQFNLILIGTLLSILMRFKLTNYDYLLINGQVGCFCKVYKIFKWRWLRHTCYFSYAFFHIDRQHV